jgi:hypothetical protein
MTPRRDHTASPVIRDYDLHPPDDLRLFPMPKAGVLRFDDDVFVAELRYGEIVVRHHAWRDRWFKINCTTDLEGRFVETGPPDDVPPVDLWLDVLVHRNAVSHAVYDEDEFEDAIAELHPFGPTNVPEAPAMKRVELSEAGLLRPGVRASW